MLPYSFLCFALFLIGSHHCAWTFWKQKRIYFDWHILCLGQCHHCCVQCSSRRFLQLVLPSSGTFSYLNLSNCGLFKGTAQDYVHMYTYFLCVMLFNLYLDQNAWECLITLVWNFCSVPKRNQRQKNQCFRISLEMKFKSVLLCGACVGSCCAAIGSIQYLTNKIDTSDLDFGINWLLLFVSLL